MVAPKENVGILIVENEVIIAADLKNRLLRLGRQVVGQAHSAEQALEMTEELRPDLVLMDIMLSGDRDGIEAAEIIRDRWGVPVVFVTAYAGVERLERAMLTYPFGYILKPFQDRELQVTVEMALFTARLDAERRASEEALRRSEAEKTAILNGMKSNLAFVNDRLEIQWGNATAAASVGMVSEELIGRKCHELWAGRSEPCADCPTVKAFQTRQSEHAYIRTPDGRVWDEKGEPVFDQDGRLLGVLEIAHDVTAQARAEEALRESEEKYRAIVEHSGDAIAIFSSSSRRVVFANTRMCQLFEHTFEELTAMSPDELMDMVHPEDRPMLAERFDRRLTGGNPPNRYDLRLLSPRGKRKWVEVYAQSITYQGEKATLAGCRDITARKEAEEALELALQRLSFHVENTPLAVVEFDSEYTIISWSRGAENIFGWKAEELLGTRIGEFKWVHEDDLEEVTELMADMAANSRTSNVYSNRNYRRDGSVIHCEWFNSAMIDSQGGLVSVLSLVLDVTERTRAESALKEKSRLQQALLDAFPCVALLLRPKTREIVASNRAAAEVGAVPGAKCYSTWGRREAPCPWCLAPETWETGESRHKVVETLGVWFDAYWIPIDDDLYMHFAFDITEAKRTQDALAESREKYKQSHTHLVSLMENTDDLILIGDQNGVPVIYNSAYARMIKKVLGLDMAPGVKPHRYLKSEDSRAFWREQHQRVLAGEAFRKDYSYRDPDGNVIHLEVLFHPIVRDGEVKGFAEVTRDITDRKMDEMKLKDALNEKDVLLKELHHRVKNNMQVIISLMNIQASRLDDERVRIAFEESQNRIHAMAAVHETLHQSENITNIDLREYLSKLCLTTLESAWSGREHEFELEVEPIEVRLEQSYPIGLVINELVSNILKYAFPDGRKGKIRLSGARLSSNQAVLVMEDDGVGLPAGFDWRRADTMGLKIVRDLVEIQLGGGLELDSSNGARWTITFPLAD